MTTTVPSQVAQSGAFRLLADVRALEDRDIDPRPPALIRLEAALGRDFADRLMSALSEERDLRHS
jgi:hypothetical protein